MFAPLSSRLQHKKHWATSLLTCHCRRRRREGKQWQHENYGIKINSPFQTPRYFMGKRAGRRARGSSSSRWDHETISCICLPWSFALKPKTQAYYRARKMARTWFGDISLCCSLTTLLGPDWVLLNYMFCKQFLGPVHSLGRSGGNTFHECETLAHKLWNLTKVDLDKNLYPSE